MVRALALACHPVPSLAVTATASGLAALAGLPPHRCVLLAGAVLTGQLSIGWSNDHLDAERDRAVHRSDKPAALGAVPPWYVAVAATAALAVTAVLSAALGPVGGTAALVGVLCGWLYNVGLKATVMSWLPYAIAFGLLPAIVTLSASPPRWPAGWASAAGALLGIAAHLANVLPDLRDDAATGVRGLPHRLGAAGTAVAAAGALAAGSAVVLLGAGEPGRWSWAGLAVVAGATATAVPAALRDPSSRRFFLAIVLVAALDLVFFALNGTRL